MLWTKVPDEWERPQWMPLAYVPLAQATREEAALHLVADSLRYERDRAGLDRFEAVTSAGHITRQEWDAIAWAIWPMDEAAPPVEDNYPVTQWLAVPPGEEHRVAAVLAALHDAAFGWDVIQRRKDEEYREWRRRRDEFGWEGLESRLAFDPWARVDHVDVRLFARALAHVDTSAEIRGDMEAMKLMAFLQPTFLRHGTGRAGDPENKLPNVKCSVTQGGVTYHSVDGGDKANAIAVELWMTLPKYFVHFERPWTPEAGERLRAYLARPGYVIPRGTGTREAAGSMAAVYMALTGMLANRVPRSMSYVIGRWIVLIQDEISTEERNGVTWRNVLPLAARTSRAEECEHKRVGVVVSWMWQTVLPTLQPVAEKYDIGMIWRRVVLSRSVASATAGVKAIDDALERLGEHDFVPALHDDDLEHLSKAARATIEVAVALDESGDSGIENARACVDATVRAVAAARRTGVSWRTLEPLAVLYEMVDA
ncbi:MAG: hypothetical protein F4Y01_16405 [Gammaproteobacteria bacterium]|nr:hypothetical protein [Gammaproteobacteria bacterium]